jgi:hypothetical protein
LESVKGAAVKGAHRRGECAVTTALKTMNSRRSERLHDSREIDGEGSGARVVA